MNRVGGKALAAIGPKARVQVWRAKINLGLLKVLGGALRSKQESFGWCKSSAFGTSLVNFHSDEDDDGMVMVMTRGVPNTSGMKKAIKTKRVGGGEY